MERDAFSNPSPLCPQYGGEKDKGANTQIFTYYMLHLPLYHTKYGRKTTGFFNRKFPSTHALAIMAE